LNQPDYRLNRNTPEQLIRNVLAGGADEGSNEIINTIYFVLSACFYSKWLGRDDRIEQAHHVLADARDRLSNSPFPFPYLRFAIDEAEALVYRAEWRLSGRSCTMLNCYRHLERAAVVAENLNLIARARKLRALQPS
jgi:hypothetical protein